MSTNRPQPQVGILTFVTPGGNTMGRAVHVSMADSISGPWPRMTSTGQAAEWALQLGPGMFANLTHELLPQGLRSGYLGMHAQTVDDAAKALERACVALETFLADHEDAKVSLERQVMRATEYGKVAELPLGDVADYEPDAGDVLADLVKGVQREAPHLLQAGDPISQNVDPS